MFSKKSILAQFFKKIRIQLTIIFLSKHQGKRRFQIIRWFCDINILKISLHFLNWKLKLTVKQKLKYCFLTYHVKTETPIWTNRSAWKYNYDFIGQASKFNDQSNLRIHFCFDRNQFNSARFHQQKFVIIKRTFALFFSISQAKNHNKIFAELWAQTAQF